MSEPIVYQMECTKRDDASGPYPVMVFLEFKANHPVFGPEAVILETHNSHGPGILYEIEPGDKVEITIRKVGE